METRSQLSGSAIIEALRRARVSHVVALPDIMTSRGLLWPISQNPEFRLIRICKEDEGISICAGLALCGHRPVLMMQHTGLLDSLNAVEAVAVAFGHPIFMIVGLQGKEPGCLPAQSRRLGIRALEPILSALKVRTVLVRSTDDGAALDREIDQTFTQRQPTAALIAETVGA